MVKNYWKMIKNGLRGKSRGFSGAELEFVLAKSFIPEQIPSLMEQISNGRGFLVQNYVGFENGEWMILVGYPLEGEFISQELESVINIVVRSYHPRILWLIAPALPASLSETATLTQTDTYFQLNLETYKIPSDLMREVRKTESTLKIDFTSKFTQSHQELVSEFMQRQELPPLVSALYQSMPQYLKKSSTATLINARDIYDKLCAFYVVERAAIGFDAYILGCYSRENYVPHASDRLFYEMILSARQRGKEKLQLGLGVNPGIRRFKEKWGGKPFWDYQAWEINLEGTTQSGVLDWFSEGKW